MCRAPTSCQWQRNFTLRLAFALQDSEEAARSARAAWAGRKTLMAASRARNPKPSRLIAPSSGALGDALFCVRTPCHRAWLNRGDFASYGLAKTGPNLFSFKDTDFAHTDVPISGASA
jgi:hypothetical protein